MLGGSGSTRHQGAPSDGDVTGDNTGAWASPKLRQGEVCLSPGLGASLRRLCKRLLAQTW